MLIVRGESPRVIDDLIEAGHWKKARLLVDAQLQSNPRDAQAHSWMSKIKSSFNDLEGSVAEAERSVTLDRSKAGYHAQLAEACALMADKSNVLKGLVYVQRMKAEIGTALSLDPSNIDTLLVEMMFSAKAPMMAGGDKKLANRIADKIVTISPVWGFLAHARLLQDHGDDSVTENWLQQSVRAAPSFYRARISLARFYCCTAHAKRPDLAEKTAREAMELDPSASGAYEILARVYAGQQRWNDLEAILAKADKAVPDDASPYFSAAKGLLEIGQDFRRAERYLSRYLSQEPEGRRPTHADARVLLASLYEREGRTTDAVRELRAALRLQPDSEDAKSGLKRLRAS